MKNTKNIKRSFILHMLPKIIVFGMALSNFVFIWFHQKNQMNQVKTTISFCENCSWYETWSFTNEPSILLLAAFLLLFSKRWGYVLASALSGYIVIYVLFYLIRAIIYFGLFDLWKDLQKSEPSIFLIWETQLIWAVIIFGVAIFYLLRDIFYNNTSRNRLL